MARPLRLESPEFVYHVTSRGNVWQGIIPDDRDCTQLLTILAHAVGRSPSCFMTVRREITEPRREPAASNQMGGDLSGKPSPATRPAVITR